MSRSKIWEDSMKPHTVTLASAIFVSAASIAYAASTTVNINAIDANGVGKKIGTIELSDTNEGLRITPQLTELPPGDHGFHIHLNPNCGPGSGPNGQPAAGMAARLHGPKPTQKGQKVWSQRCSELPQRRVLNQVCCQVPRFLNVRT